MKLFFTLFFNLLCLYGFSQTILLKGIVTDSVTHEPLSGVTMRVGKTGTRTNIN
jgi:hypothetical protein